MEFSGEYVASIEAGLERNARTQGRWARLIEADLSPGSCTIEPIAAWRITLPQRAVVCPEVEQLHVLVDKSFPASDPRLVVPGLKEDGSWPHVEDSGRLCLAASRASADAGERVLYHISCALDLLNFDKPTRNSEFQREFATYWQRGAQGLNPPRHLSLVGPAGPSREVFYAQRSDSDVIVWADSKEHLVTWFQNAGASLAVKAIRAGWVAWLSVPLVPADFPRKGQEALALASIPDAVLQRAARIGRRLPLLLGTQTSTGPVWVVADIAEAPFKGFRRRNSLQPATAEMVRKRLAEVPVWRLPVERVDGPYVHGRDHNKEYKDLASMRVAIVGCGSLGGSVARLLAQAGVGQFVLVDGDKLAAHNTSRHVLGQFYLGENKAKALGALLEQDFPHQAAPIAVDSRVEKLTAEQWEQLAASDLIVSAGIDYLGDWEISRWRRKEPYSRPYHVSTWVEPFALAGHAVAMLEDRDISAVVDEEGSSRYELTKWKTTSQYEVTEAGCGNSFQPHGAVDLQRTVAVAARLCLDVLAGKAVVSTRRIWLGDRDAVQPLGGTVTAEFDQSNAEKTLPWPQGAPVIP